LECLENGPESIYLSSSYYYMGELFRKEVMEKDLSMQNPMYSTIDEYYYHEAIQHLNIVKNFFEQEFGHDHVVTAESNVSFALVCLKTGDVSSCMEHLRKAKLIFENYQGATDFKTKEVNNLINELE